LTSTSTLPNPIQPLPPTASISELRAKLQNKLDTFRRDRGVEDETEPRSRDALETERRVKRGEMRDRRRRTRKKEREGTSKPAKVCNPCTLPYPSSTTVNFLSRVYLADPEMDRRNY